MLMETIPAKITPRLAAAMDELIHEGWYANRSEFIRDAVRDKVRSAKVTQMEAAIREDIAWGFYGKD